MSWGWDGYVHRNPLLRQPLLKPGKQLRQRQAKRLSQPEVALQRAQHLPAFDARDRRRIHARGGRQIDKPQLPGASQGA